MEGLLCIIMVLEARDISLLGELKIGSFGVYLLTSITGARQRKPSIGLCVALICDGTNETALIFFSINISGPGCMDEKCKNKSD